MPVDLAALLLPACASALSLHARLAGAACTRHSLRPLFSSRATIDASLGHFVPRECERVSNVVIASEAKQSRNFPWKPYGLLRRGACHRAARSRGPVGSSQ